MQTFQNTEHLYKVMARLWTYIKEHPEISHSLLQSGLVVQFNYRDPEGRLTIDGSNGQELKIHFGQNDLKADVEMSMKSAIADEFWKGSLNVPLALINGSIVSKGPVHKALALLPAIKPAFSVYPDFVSGSEGNAA
jgi:2-oxoisovalerate dehydrogenase E1 component